MGAAVGWATGACVGKGDAVGAGFVGAGVGLDVGVAVGDGAGVGVGSGVDVDVGVGVGVGVGAGVGVGVAPHAAAIKLVRSIKISNEVRENNMGAFSLNLDVRTRGLYSHL